MLSPVVLEDEHERLEPFSDTHKAEVARALDHDPEAWHGMVGADYGRHFEPWWSAAITAMESGSRIAYAVRRQADQQVVGTTSLYEIRFEHLRCEIGSTFYVPAVRQCHQFRFEAAASRLCLRSWHDPRGNHHRRSECSQSGRYPQTGRDL